jgi:VWFA-related protein
MLRYSTFAILVAASGFALAQESQSPGQDFTLNVDVELVELPVSVLDRNGRPVGGLAKEHFQIFEDGVLQDISLFKHEDLPLSAGLVIDNSGSMRNKRQRTNAAALTFVRESNPEDEMFVVNFDDFAYLEKDFTSNIDEIIEVLRTTDTQGQTALYDAVYLSAIHLHRGKKDKKALLLISDGEDTSSNYSFDKMLSEVRASKATIYAIGLLDENNGRGRRGRSRGPSAREVLQRIAEVSGGRAYFPESVDEIEELCRRIAEDLRNHYTLGYSPSNKKLDGSWRKVALRINPPRGFGRLTFRAKEGYYAPTTADTQRQSIIR